MENKSTKEILSYLKKEIPILKKLAGWIAEWQLQSRAQLNLLLSLFSSTMIGAAISALGIVVGGISLVTLIIKDYKLTLLLGILVSILGITTFLIFLILACGLKKHEQKFLDEVPKLEELSQKLKYFTKEGDMALRGPKTPIRIEITPETIEAHLKEQDKEIKRSEWLAFIVFGASIALSGVFLIVSRYNDIVAYAFIVLYGFALALYGWVRGSKIK